ncbi:Replication gene A protein, partial [Exaiptasia diaphana]
MSAVNQDGDEYSLAELAELGLSNPTNRHAEMIVRVKGIQEWAGEHGHAAGFFTLTCPSRFHCMKKKPFGRNAKWDGSSVRDAHQYLNKVWQKVYSAWNRAEIDWYGMWISEPHHDGTPHRHGIIFCPPHQFRKMTKIFSEYAYGIHPCTKRQIETRVPRYRGVCWLENAGGEKGADKHRFAMERIWYLPEDEDRAKLAGKEVSSVIAYVIKYISKNIATDSANQVGLDDYGQLASESCQRVAAWAGIHGIRQFNFVKCPPVGVYRELRKLDAEREKEVQQWHEINQASQKNQYMLGKARAAADAGDFAQYIVLQGGPCLPRSAYPLKLWKGSKRKTDAVEFHGDRDGSFKRGRYGEVVEAVFGLSVNDINHYQTRFHSWTIAQIARSEGQSAGEAEAPRTCVNNSTLSEISVDEARAISVRNQKEAASAMLQFMDEWEAKHGLQW